ncbi:MAG: FKBP-type peptidyl-prolyl cis-trans isomerase [Bacteroidales bacterium]|nr:FKBP-type peptidyl-prolyl cis-trans isomerase [Bacteroidales bacterium]
MTQRCAFVIALLSLMACACRDVPVVDNATAPADSLKERLINANRTLAQSEQTAIEAYVSRRGWQMETLNGGGRLLETDNGNNRPIEYGDTVSFTYRLEAINGAVLYDNRRDTVVVGRVQLARGLDQALAKLHYGSEARLILPSEQAYGVAGDGDRIGSRIPLVYTMKIDLKKITKHNAQQ